MSKKQGEKKPRWLFSAKLELKDNIVEKMAGCLSFDYYNITMRVQVTAHHLGKFLDFLLNAEWEDQWGSISISEILKVEKKNRPIQVDVEET